jgi:hypothetical protein
MSNVAPIFYTNDAMTKSKTSRLTPRTWNRGVKPYSIKVPSQAKIIHSGGTRVGSFK